MVWTGVQHEFNGLELYFCTSLWGAIKKSSKLEKLSVLIFLIVWNRVGKALHLPLFLKWGDTNKLRCTLFLFPTREALYLGLVTIL